MEKTLKTLLHRAKHRFPDVIRDLADGDSMNEFTNEKVWGNKDATFS